MSNNGKPGPTLIWNVQLRIPVPVRLARRASKTALEKWLARAVVGAIQTMPPEFIVNSAMQVKADIGQLGAKLVDATGKPYRV
jgi:hypothetical protein